MIVGKTEELGIEIAIDGTKDLDCLKELDIAVIDKLFLHMYKPISLKFLKDFPNLKQLLIVGSLKNLEFIAQCSTIEELALQNGTIDSLDFTLNLSLKKLVLENIKTRVDRLEIPNIPTLENLGLSGIHKVGDLDFLSDFIGLRELTLSWLKAKRLFDFSNLRHLECLYMYRMLHLTNIKELSTASALNFLSITETPKLKMQELKVVANMKSLEKLHIPFITENPNSYKRYVQELGYGNLLYDGNAST
jgi:hypothetical protein